ncbi:hypothetical protein IGI37_001123 [Enterococcus sp. AZ194]
MNTEEKRNLEKIIKEQYDNIAGITILQNGEERYEVYLNKCTKKSKFHVYSVSKSILSILFGIALDKGYIKSLDQKVLSFFPSYITKRREKTIQQITLRDMLTMTAPYKYKLAPLTYIRYFMSNDWKKFSLDLLGGKGKIGEFKYTPLVGPDILSGVLESVTGKTVFDFASEYLFGPLNIEVEKNITFQTAKEQTAFNKSTNMSGWVCDPKGLNAGGWGLTLSVKDMSKIGQLYLNDGQWEGERVVSSKWIEESTCEHSRWDKIGLSYGYLWWLVDKNKGIYCAMGDGGNTIYCNREKQLVIAIASLFVPKANDRIKFINEYIEPLFDTSDLSPR